MTTDLARSVAFDSRAPQDERTDALAELQRGAVPTALLSDEVMGQIFEFADLQKSINKNPVPFPGKNQGKPGMQSVLLNDVQISIQGDWYDKRGNIGFNALRQMVEQTPVLNAVVMTRIRQVLRFCSPQESGEGMGFTIRHVDKDHQITKSEKESVAALTRFIAHCGWEFNPRQRKRLKRDSFPQFMSKAVRDSLVMDSAPIETEFKNDRKKGIDGFYAVDGSTIRLCTEDGYRGDDEIFALQVIDGNVRSAYTHDDLIYEPRNPQSDVLSAGYGLGEPELLVRVVTGFLNAMTYNIKGFDSNSIPKGMLHLSGDYSQEDLSQFKRYWNGMVKGVNNAWALPVMISKDQESKASFEKFGIDYDEMAFGKWMTFLTSIICAIYGMSPSEINFDSFSGGNTSPMAGSDTAEKLADSKDKGLRPLLAYFESEISDFIISDFSSDFVFRWTGLDEEDRAARSERAKLILSVNEMRAQDGYDKMDGPLGEAPLNPSLIGPWMQLQQADGAPDMGQPDEEAPQQKGDKNESGNPAQQAIPQGFGAGDKSGHFGANPEKSGHPKTQESEPRQSQSFGKALDQTGGAIPAAARLGVDHGDEVFYAHPAHGLASGKVLAHGKDGFTVAHESGPLGIPWEDYHGHKSRKERHFTPVEQGEDGMIAEESGSGRRVYLHGEIPEESNHEKAK